MLMAGALGVAGTLSACASADMANSPSLAPRPIERRVAVAAQNGAPAQMIPAPVSATLAEAIRALTADAERGDGAFRAALTELGGRARAATGAPTGSEAWADGEAALSRIMVARGPTTLALTELDRLAIAQGDASGTVPPELLAAQARVAALVAAQDAALAGLD